jgi:hypothetical protein
MQRGFPMAIEKNVGTLDRFIRLVVAGVIFFLWYNGTLSGLAGIILGIIALILLVTSLISFCPLFRLFGLSTRKK